MNVPSMPSNAKMMSASTIFSLRILNSIFLNTSLAFLAAPRVSDAWTHTLERNSQQTLTAVEAPWICSD